MPKLNVPVEFLQDYLDYLKTNYVAQYAKRLADNDPVAQEMVANKSFSYEVGSSYVKIIAADRSSRSVHSFIVNKVGKFPLGAVLKPAGWSGPAKNFARADLLKRDTWVGRVSWTGVS